MSVECIWPLKAKLAEGPLWSARDHALWFVDIKGCCVHRYDEPSGKQHTWNAPEHIGFIAPTASGRFIAGMKSGLYLFDQHTGAFTLITLVDSGLPDNRLNDACVDPAGRLWFGSMDNNECNPSGSLYRFDRDGLRRCDEGYVITNGPSVCPQGRTLYHIDTLKRVIYAFDLNKQGVIANRRVFANIEKPGAWPDGPVVDADGCVWVGLYGGWGVQKFSPAGEALDFIELPVANCTKVAFGGDDGRTLYMTTAWQGLSDEQRAQQPLAGSIFRTRVDTPGLPQYKVAGW
ncbi:MAG TPA: SMP-30/gluconolactonase/LRE family protein [Povalibacter sp.]|nr:SMP-30/gluconolactonase/LRE family protein [Povalibacter sp.]